MQKTFKGRECAVYAFSESHIHAYFPKDYTSLNLYTICNHFGSNCNVENTKFSINVNSILPLHIFHSFSFSHISYLLALFFVEAFHNISPR